MVMDDFVKDPHEFARLYPITTRWGAPVNPDPEVWKEKSFQVDNLDVQGYQMPGRSRIFWFCILESTSDGKPGESELDLSQEEKEKYLPAYWLPWSTNQIFRTTLRPSGKSDSNADPDYFWTAPVDGCSVFVEGPPEEPTVYHANAQAHGGGFGQDLTVQQFVNLQRDKALQMRKRYKAFSAAHEKSGKHGLAQGVGPGPKAVELNMTHYYNRGFQRGFEREFDEVVENLKTAAEGAGLVINEDKGNIKITQVKGTVFGVRKDGKWKFYFQKRVEVSYLVNKQKRDVAKMGLAEYGQSFFSKKAYADWWNPEWEQENSWLTLTCSQFWPDGGGQAVVRIQQQV